MLALKEIMKNKWKDDKIKLKKTNKLKKILK